MAEHDRQTERDERGWRAQSRGCPALTAAVQVSLACWPSAHQIDALLACLNPDGTSPLHEPLWGNLQAQHVQLVPQSRGPLDEQLVQTIKDRYPHTRFRLHANARVQIVHRIIDLADLQSHPQAKDWFQDAARVSQWLQAPVYSAHSGLRSRASLSEMLDNARTLTDWFGCPVAVEGQYPTKEGEMLVNSWDEYQALLESGVPYALDLSHLNILARWTGSQERTLVAEMLASERCLEVHVSANDGTHDQHRLCASKRAPWWGDLMHHIHRDAVIFSEGNHRLRRSPAPQA